MSTERIDALVDELKKAGAFKDRVGFEVFTRSYLRFATQTLLGFPAKELRAFLEARYDVLAAGAPDRITVKVVNPEDARSHLSDEDGVAETGPLVSRVEVHMKDRPFILATLQEYFRHRDARIVSCFHPILAVTRAKGGKVEKVEAAGDGKTNESLIFLEVERLGDAPKLEAARVEILECLQGVEAVTDDFPAMGERFRKAIEETEGPGFPKVPCSAQETRELLQWLLAENFVFFGCRDYTYGKEGKAQADGPSSRGVLRLKGPLAAMLTAVDLSIDTHVNARAKEEAAVTVLRTDVVSRIYRWQPFDFIAVKSYDKAGKPTGVRVFVGAFSNRVITEKVHRIPVVREKVAAAIAQMGFVKGSHHYKRATYTLDSLPKEDLFYSNVEELVATLEAVIEAEEVAGVRVFVTTSKIGMRIRVVVVMPKDAYTTEVKAAVDGAVRGVFGGGPVRDYVCWGEEQTLRLHYYVSRPEHRPGPAELEELVSNLTRLVQPWRATYLDLMHRTFPGADGDAVARKYRRAFRESYTSIRTPFDAVTDSYLLEAFVASGQPQAIMVNPPGRRGPQPSGTELRIFTDREHELNRVVPILANFGLHVHDEDAFRIEPAEGPPLFIMGFHVSGPDRKDIEDPKDHERIAGAVAAILAGDHPDHALNALILGADLTHGEVDLLIAYRNYYLQLNKDYPPATVDESLVGHPALVRLFLEFFRARFHPSVADHGDKKHREEAVLPKLQAAIKDELSRVQGIAADKILRNFGNLLAATVRTTFFKQTRRKLVAFKVRCADVWEMPTPRPFMETYVHGQKVEAIHLRGGPVARGGLRWSDRRDDFRTEVLGLMKTQMIKNALIVPVGAKGGFFPELGNLTGKERAEEGLAQYRIFVSGVLELADTYGPKNEELRPKDVFCWDGFDPYVVVAADKGTATFSDFANELSAEFGHWLGDAFASGGSVGYSHKDLGITAKGGWECVKRHFRELGKDIQKEDFTCVGIGDMAGDVFGNGMILSEHTRLLAAFNHLHIFVDPSPDAAASFKERKRLFDNPKLMWTDYDAKLISKGGGVYPRAAKVIKLSPEARAALGTDKESVNGEELIAIILKAPAELLWNGGIGTYIKASSENHHEIGDKANDRVRVDAAQLRCKVIGEGGNLGMTPKARVEFSERGGYLNTDAIDNSAGVDLSDHEVNTKILMGGLMRKGLIADLPARNKILKEIEAEICDLVLKDNYRQSLVISLDKIRSSKDMGPFLALLRTLEEKLDLDRRVEAIGDDQHLLGYQISGKGLPRSNLSVLVGSAKRLTFGEIMGSTLPDDPACRHFLIEYFPKAVHQKFGEALFEHRLRREIVATMMTNKLVEQTGTTYLHSESRALGLTVAEVAKSYLLADAFLGGDALREQLYALDNKVAAPAQYAALLELEDTVCWVNRSLLSRQDLKHLTFENVAARRGAIQQLMDGLAGRLPESTAKELEGRITQLTKVDKFPAALAKKIAYLPFLRDVLRFIRVSEEAKLDLLDVAQAFYQVGAELRFDWVQEQARKVAGRNEWDVQFLNRLSSDLYVLQGDISKAVIRGRSDGEAIGAATRRYFEGRQDRVQVLHRDLERLAAAGVQNLIPIDLMRDRYRELLG